MLERANVVEQIAVLLLQPGDAVVVVAVAELHGHCELNRTRLHLT